MSTYTLENLNLNQGRTHGLGGGGAQWSRSKVLLQLDMSEQKNISLIFSRLTNKSVSVYA